VEEVVVRVTVLHAPGPQTGGRPRRRRPLAGAARAALLWGAVMFLLAQLGLALAIETHLPELREPYYAYKARRLRERLASTPAPRRTVVMLGSSRTVYALRGQFVEAQLAAQRQEPVIVYNFGLPGAGPLTQLITLRRLLAHGIRPDGLLLEVLPPVFAGHVPLAEVNRLLPERLWREDLPVAEPYLAPDARLRSSWYLRWLLPAYTHRFAIMSKVAPALLPFQLRLDWFRDIDGCGWTLPPWRERTPERVQHAVERTRAEYLHYLKEFRLGGTSCAALRELLVLCRDEGIPTVLVVMPEGSEFQSWYPPGAWEQVEGYLAGLHRDHGVPIITARDWSRDDEFSDSHHLMPEGAKRFTIRLGREVIVPLLEGKWEQLGGNAGTAGKRSPPGSHGVPPG
jgi:hypothetical protein